MKSGGDVCQPAVDYYDKLKESPRITAVDKDKDDFQYQTESFHEKFHNGWAKTLIYQNPKKFVVSPIPTFDEDPKDHPINLDKSESQKDIEESRVIKFLNQKETSTVGKIEPLSKVSKPIEGAPFVFNLPKNEIKYECFLTVALKSFEVKDPKPNEEYSGFMYLFDFDRNEAVSEPVYFTFTHQGVKYVQTEKDTVYFAVKNINEKIMLAVFLLKKPTNTSNKLLFACNYVQLFNSDKVFVSLQLSDNWSTGKNHDSISTLFKLDPDQFDTFVRIKSQIEVKQIFDNGDLNFSYTWKDNSKNSLEILPMPNFPSEPTPIVSIYNINLELKSPPKNANLYIKAIVSNTVVKKFYEKGNFPQAIPAFPAENSKMASEFISSSFYTTNEMALPDSIRVYVCETMTPQSHLIIYLMSRELKKEKDNDSIYKVAIIPLKNLSDQAQLNQKFILYDLKNIPKNYLDSPKPAKKTFIQCTVNLPPAYFPPPFSKHLMEASGDELVVPEGTGEQLMGVMIPITAKLLTKISPKVFDVLVEFLNRFDFKLRNEILRPWVYNTFDPATCNPIKLCAMLREYIDTNLILVRQPRIDATNSKNKKDKKDKKDKHKTSIQNEIIQKIMEADKNISNLFRLMSFFLDIIATTLTSSSYSLDHKPVVEFFKLFPQFLIEMYKMTKPDVTQHMAERFSQVFYLIQTVFTNKELNDIVFQYMYDLAEKRDEHNRTMPDFLRMQLALLQPLMITPNFIVGCCSITKHLGIEKPFSPYSKVLSQMFKMTQNIFSYNIDEDLNSRFVTTFCSMFSRFTRELEEIKDEEVVSHVCYSLFPLVHIISQFFDQLSTKWELQAAIVPFILKELNSSSPILLQAFFKYLPSMNQKSFISFLKSVVEVVSKCKIARLSFFAQTTQRIIQFLLNIVDELSRVMPIVVDVLASLLTTDQTPVNFPIFYTFIKQVIEKHKCERMLINLLLDKMSSEVHSMRCLCTALLYQQIISDFKTNRDIVQSSIDIMDSLTTILLRVTPDQIAIYRVFIETVLKIAEDRVSDNLLKKMIIERMQAATVIADVVREQKSSKQPPEIRCHQTMKIADQYKAFPSMRREWLRQVYNINIEANDKISAFVTQMHIVALVSTVYNYIRQKSSNSSNSNVNTKFDRRDDPPFHLAIVQPIANAYPKYVYQHSQNYLDFAFMQEVTEETSIDFKSFTKGSLELLSNFNFEMMNEELSKAYQIGIEAEMIYSLRPLCSLQLRTFYLSRNFKGVESACQSIQNALRELKTETSTLTHDFPLAFFLVEKREDSKNSKAVSRQVYCVNSKESDKFLENISSFERFGDLQPCYCTKHSDECLKKKGVCIVKLEPTDNIPVDNEDPHCWSCFQTKITTDMVTSSSMNEKIPIVAIKTKIPVPHYKMSIDVVSFKVDMRTPIEIVEDQATYSAAVLDIIAEGLENWYETDNSYLWGLPPVELFSNDFFEKLQTLLTLLGKNGPDQNSTAALLKALFEKDSEKAKKIVKDIIAPSLGRALKIFLKAKKEMRGDVSNIDDKIKRACEEANLFLKGYDVDAVEDKDMYIGKVNSMDQKFKFEK